MSGGPKTPRSIWYSMSTPSASFTVGISFQGASGIRLASNTASGRTRSAFQWLTHSIGLFTVESMCLPTRLTHTSPALEGNVGELHAQRVLELHGDDLVLLLRAGAAHLHPVLSARSLLDHGQVVLRGLVGRLGVHPEDEAVEGHARDRRQVPPIERGALRQRRGEQVRERDDDRVRVTFLLLDVEEALGARAARLVDRDERLRRKLVLLGDAADQPRHLIRASARSGGDDELDRP